MKSRKEYQRAYYWANAERLRARARAWRERNKEKVNRQQREAKRRQRREHHDEVLAKERAYRAKPGVRARMNANNRKWREVHREDYLKRKRERRALNLESYKRSERRAELRRNVRKMLDAEYYHKRLALTRVLHARARLRKGKPYRPRFHLRIPEWMTLGQRVLDAASPFLDVNLTPSQRAYARELAIERRKA